MRNRELSIRNQNTYELRNRELSIEPWNREEQSCKRRCKRGTELRRERKRAAREKWDVWVLRRERNGAGWSEKSEIRVQKVKKGGQIETGSRNPTRTVSIPVCDYEMIFQQNRGWSRRIVRYYTKSYESAIFTIFFQIVTRRGWAELWNRTILRY